MGCETGAIDDRVTKAMNTSSTTKVNTSVHNGIRIQDRSNYGQLLLASCRQKSQSAYAD